MRWIVRIATSVLSLALLVGGPAAAQDAKPGKAAKAPAAAGSSTTWWNEPRFLDELALNEEQREKMDAHLATFKKAAPEEARRTKFNQALQDGDWKLAKSELERLSELAAAAVGTRGQLKLSVISELTDAQRKTLVDKFPRLIFQPWTRAMRVDRER